MRSVQPFYNKISEKKPMRKLLPILFVFVLSLSAFGQTKNIIATTEDGKRVVLNPDKTWEYKTETPKRERISQPENVLSTDSPEDIKSFVNSISEELQKNEFETEEEYQRRITKLIKEKQFNGKPINQIGFVVEDFSPSYSAEEQSFTLFITPSQKNLRLVDRKYGRFTVTHIDKLFKMSPEKAKESKSLMEVIVYGLPIEYSNYLGFEVVPTQMVVRNKNSGKIYFNASIDNFLGSGNNSVSFPEPITVDSSPPIQPSTNNGPKTVQVDGYFRKDGTYVRPHTRTAPRRKN